MTTQWIGQRSVQISILWAFNQKTFRSQTNPISTYLLYTILRSLHSRKLHILGFRARTVCTNSLVIFFFSLSDKGTYHFWSLSLPCRLNSSMNCIWNEDIRNNRGAVKHREDEVLMLLPLHLRNRTKTKHSKSSVLSLFMWWWWSQGDFDKLRQEMITEMWEDNDAKHNPIKSATLRRLV